MESKSSPSPSPNIPSPNSATPPPQRASYSSRLGVNPKGSSTNPPRQQPAVQQKAWTGKNPITNRPINPPQANGQTVPNRLPPPQPQSQQQPPLQSLLGSFREGQRVRITLTSGAEFEGIFSGANESGCNLRIVQQKKLPGGIVTNSTKREEQNMTLQRKDIASASIANNVRPQNGNRPGFRTDAAISNNRSGQERTLKKWEPEATDDVSLSLESSHSGHWDQFAENERRFGLKTDYDETIYTTAIDKSHPQYKQRLAEADKKAREIQNTTALTAHVAEERVMDFSGTDKGGDEEDKYSGVRRQQDFPPLSTGGSNKYTPPARRAPTSQANAHGVPVDPAIISSVVKGSGKKAVQSKPEDKVALPSPAAKVPSPAPVSTPQAKSTDGKTTPKPDPRPAEATKPVEKTAIPLRPSAGASAPAAAATTPPKVAASQGKDGIPPSATSTVERDVLNSFKSFAANQRLNAAQVRHNKAKHDKEIKLIELKKFAEGFKLSTPVPNDLIGIIAKDPAKQQQIQAKALQNAEEVAKARKDAAKEKEVTTTKAVQTKPTPTTEQTITATQNETRPNTRAPSGPTSTAPAAITSARHTQNNRQSYGPGYHNQNLRHNQSPGHNIPQQGPRTGNLGARLRAFEQAKNTNVPQINHHNVQQAHMSVQDMRPPPTGPSNAVDYNATRRLSGAPVAGKLNPNSHEFRPGGAAPFIPQFHPNSGHPSAGSSPRSSVNHMGEPPAAPSSANRGQLIHKKTQSVDINKCNILAFIKTVKPPPTKNWEDNDGLRPSFDTLPTWRQLQDDEKPDSTMHLTYPEYFEKQPFSNASIATPSPQHAMPMAHQHQLPFHLQAGAHMGTRQSPHMPHVQMQGGPQPHPPHVPYSNAEDNRMVPSNSQQSFQSPRISQVPMAYPPTMNSPAQMGYSQPGMPYMGAPGNPQMNSHYRNYPSAQYGMPQQPHMGPPMMMQPPFVGGAPQGVPQMQMYPGGHPPQFMPPGGAPAQPMPGANGYPSPGRPAAPMMAHQGSQQGQQMYGMSPGMQYQQPVYPPQQQGKYPKNGPPAQMRKY